MASVPSASTSTSTPAFPSTSNTAKTKIKVTYSSAVARNTRNAKSAGPLVDMDDMEHHQDNENTLGNPFDNREATAASSRGVQQGTEWGGEGNPGLMVVLETGTNSGDRGNTFTPTAVLADNSVSMGRPENLPPRLPNRSTGYNALSTTLTVVTEVPEHTASDAQLSVSVPLNETGSIVNSLPGTSDALNSAQVLVIHGQKILS